MTWSGLPAHLVRFTLFAAASSCVGAVEDPNAVTFRRPDMLPGTGGAGPDEVPVPVGLPPRDLAARSGLRRLTGNEYDNTVRDLLADDSRSSQLILEEDLRNPFDNDYTAPAQTPTKAAVEGFELLSRDAATRWLADARKRDLTIGCKGTDPKCLGQFISRFGRRALRRPLEPDEVQRYLKVAGSSGDFNTAIETVVRVLLQDPEFLYRIEVGTQVAPGLFKLGSWEMASRLSYFLWGTAPDDPLLDRAAAHTLDTPEQIRGAAAAMLADKRAIERIARFHALWLGYEDLSQVGSLAPAMKTESDSLVARVIFSDKRPWQDLLRSKESYVNQNLLKHYGMPIPAGLNAGTKNFVWAAYNGGTSRRRGLLSHGSFLASANTEDELLLPIRRGKLIRERLFCQALPAKPANIKVENPRPPATPCKPDVLAVHRESSSCKGCHMAMDPLGFGLDNFDGLGRGRKVDTCVIAGPSCTATDITNHKPLNQCPTRAEGDLDGKPFSGPIELQDLLLASPAVNKCVATQVYRFAVGRFALDDIDHQFIDTMAKRMGDKDFRFDEVILDFVSSTAFGHRNTGT